MNMMTFLFVEYAQMQKRNQTVEALRLEPTATDQTKNCTVPRRHAFDSAAKVLPVGFSDRSDRAGLVDLIDSSLDAERYKSFAVLFGLNSKQNKGDHDSSNDKKYLASLDPVNVSFEYRLALRNDQETALSGHSSSLVTSGACSAARKVRKGPSIWDGQMDVSSPLSGALSVPAALQRDEALLEQLVGFDISTPSHAEQEEEERGKNLSSFRDFAPFRDLNKRSRTASPSTSSLQESVSVATSGLVPPKSVPKRGPPQSFSTRSQNSLPDAYSLGLFGLISSADATIANIPDTTFSSQQVLDYAV